MSSITEFKELAAKAPNSEKMNALRKRWEDQYSEAIDTIQKWLIEEHVLFQGALLEVADPIFGKFHAVSLCVRVSTMGIAIGPKLFRYQDNYRGVCITGVNKDMWLHILDGKEWSFSDPRKPGYRWDATKESFFTGLKTAFDLQHVDFSSRGFTIDEV